LRPLSRHCIFEIAGVKLHIIQPMRSSSLHIVLIVLLTLLYVSERAFPCLEDCASSCSRFCADHDEAMMTSPATAKRNADHHDVPGEQSHHCTCPCHIPALQSIAENDFSLAAPRAEYGATTPSFPSAPVIPPDHIPLV